MKLIPVILCGGAGSRLWPLSRETYPKPFIRVEDNQSLLQKALIRGAGLENVAEIIIVTNREFYFLAKDEVEKVNIKNINISYILEPSARNTAPAITSAVQMGIKAYGSEAIFLILAADHIIKKTDNFINAVYSACLLATKNKIVTFGIKPTAPETGFGYIEVDKNNINQVLRFVEKPNLENAHKYLAQGNFYWNSGMFCFCGQTFVEQMQKHSPKIFTGVSECINLSEIFSVNTPKVQLQKIELDVNSFQNIAEESIDYALLEKADDVAVVPCDLDWSDVGSWNALAEFIPVDSDGNRFFGEVENFGSKNCTVYGSGRTIGAVEIENIVVVDTPDALLIANKDKSQNVKNIYNQLKQKNHNSYKFHRTVHRPWGTYTVIEEGIAFKIKRIEVKPGASLSLQMHKHRCEHWVVVEGCAEVTNGENIFRLKANESTYIPQNVKHRLHNNGTLTLIIVEVQTGNYLGEDDIIRFDDVYGRK